MTVFRMDCRLIYASPDFLVSTSQWYPDCGFALTTIKNPNILFPSPVTGRHYHASPIQQDCIRPAGCCLVACPKCGAEAGVWCLTDLPVPNRKRLPLHDGRWEAAGYRGALRR